MPAPPTLLAKRPVHPQLHPVLLAQMREPQDDDLGASHLGSRTILMAPGP